MNVCGVLVAGWGGGADVDWDRAAAQPRESERDKRMPAPLIWRKEGNSRISVIYTVIYKK
jgi:hypothetical protein